MKEHKHAWFFRAIADGEPLDNFEGRSITGGGWIPLEHCSLDKIFKNQSNTEIRRKRKTIMIGEREVTAPCRVPPKDGDTYYVSDVFHKNLFISMTWNDQTNEYQWLGKGLVFLTQEDATNAAEAMLELLKEKK